MEEEKKILNFQETLKSLKTIIKSKFYEISILFIVLVLCVLNNLYPIEWLIHSWLYNDHYKHGPMIILFLKIIFYFKYKNNDIEIIAQKNWSLILLIVFIQGVSFYFNYYKSPFLKIVLLLPCLILIHYQLFRYKVKSSLVVLFFACLTITPFPYLFSLIGFLQILTSKFASLCLNIIGFENTVESGVISFETGRFIVGSASSGIRSFLVFPSVALVAIYNKNSTVMKDILFVCYSVLNALFFNFLRASLLLLMGMLTTPMKAYDFFHDTGNTIIIIIAILTMGLVRKKCLS